MRSSVMRGEWGRRRRVACGPKRDREGIRRTAGQGGRRRARGVSEGDIPGTRRRRARVEKRVRAAHYARDTSRSSDASGARGSRGLRALAKMKRDGKRIVAAGRQEERGRSSRGEGVKACARDEGAQGVKERNPWKSRGECFVAVTDPLAVARARQSTFSARESRRRRASQHRAIVARSAR